MGSLSDPFPPLLYPAARRDDSIIDYYHGVLIPDPYRWLEDLESPETKAFMEAQGAVTDSVLTECGEWEKLHCSITALFDHERYEAPFKRGEKYFYFHNSGLQPQSVLFVQNSLDSEPEVLLDPNGLSEDGTVALCVAAVSRDGEHLAYGISSNGSDWVTIKVMIDGRKTESVSISWVKFSTVSWTADGKGFFYSRYPASKERDNVDSEMETSINLNHQLYYHFLGTDQSEDLLCWEDSENPEYRFRATVTEDGKYIILYIFEGCDPVNKLYYYDLSALSTGLEGLKGTKGLLPFIKLVNTFEARYSVIANDDSEFTFLTNKEAPKYKLIRLNLTKPDVWTDILQEDQKDVLQYAYAVNGDQLLVCYLSNVKHILQIRDLKTGLLLHNLPLDIGSVTEVSGRREDTQIFISFSSFLTPGIIYKCDLTSVVPEIKIFREVLVPGFDRGEFLIEQVFFPSKDGTKIPMFIVSKKHITLDGSHPTLLYGYGGFNFSLTPYFSVNRIVLARNLGFVFCIANIRGGGEYGQEWHKSGSLSKKQNCFDDFIAASEFLISAGYTNSSRLCIEGGSNGGLLVAACINQRPDLFGCALAHVGVMDMLRFHKFTIGHSWTSEFGCSDKEEEFHWLVRYSPLHNVERPWQKTFDGSIQYPSTMLLTADHDDRVVPSHSFKLLATMQYILCLSMEKSPQKNPIIARIDRKAGHGAGHPTQKMIDEAADRYGFVAKMMGLSWNQ
ncbi:prolyl endopeptidase-like [Phalaenopsis equestris]|uniref:prolyl endopeptidase-like n=1 Tax=Phalaenopsis equestris TaxID=78828 RepID=UPI0009E49000|nr:prolyl endopeptidase-like [Phalaenopsis equestris]